MDITSYLLGKKNSGGGGGGGSDLDWQSLGFSGTPESIIYGYEYATEVKNNWTPSQNLNNRFYNNKNLIFMPYVDTSTATSMQSTFQSCVSLLEIALLNTSNVTTMASMFYGSQSLKKVPLINTENVTDMQYMFYQCYSLKDVPKFNTNKVTNMMQMFKSCNTLTDESLNNILLMCAGVSQEYSRTKTLSDLGFNSSYYSAAKIQSLPSYQDFIDAGWTIGY